MSIVNNNNNNENKNDRQHSSSNSSVEARSATTSNTAGCFSCIGACPRWNHANEEVKQRMEDERHEGQALLRSMVTANNNSNNSSSSSSSTTDDKIDWQAIIKKAKELHSREQELLQQQTRRERRLFVQRQRKALQKRRKFDSIGSFSINLLTYRMEASPLDGEHKPLREPSEGSTRDEENSLQSQSPPSSPKAPFVLCSSRNDNGDKTSIVDDMTRIEEHQQREGEHHTPSSWPAMIFSRSTSSELFIIEDQLYQDTKFVVGYEDDVEVGSV